MSNRVITRTPGPPGPPGGSETELEGLLNTGDLADATEGQSVVRGPDDNWIPGDPVVSKADVGLGNVDNTSDANKPISTAQAAALAGKQPLDADLTALAAIDSSLESVAVSEGSGWIRKTFAQLKTALGLTKSDLGLSNVDNTADVDKPISSATQTALDDKADLVGGVVPSGQLPSYVDDVVEVANFAALPVTGEAGKIYVTQNNNLTYRWSGSAYTEISASLALGETSATAYRGDRGKTAYDHSQSTGNPHSTTKGDVGLGNVDNTSDTSKPISIATQAAIDAVAAAKISNTLADAFSVIGANTDNTPVAIPVGASSLLGRISSGDLASLSVSDVRTLLGLTDEDIQDIIGAMVSSNTETGITVTYNDSTNKFDFSVSLPNYFLPSGAFAETYSRFLIANSQNVSSGRMYLTPIQLKAGDVVNGITFYRGSSGPTSPTNQWFCLCDSSGAILRKTVDDTNTAWANNASKRLALTSSYTITTSGLYYLGFVCAATSAGNLATSPFPTTVALATLPYMSGISAQTGITTPASVTDPVTINNAVQPPPYASVD